MSRKLIDLTGQRFGRWTVINRCGTYKDPYGYGASPMWLCRCDCGKLRAVNGNSLRRGLSTSCGCQRNESMSAAMKSYHAHKNIERGYAHVLL